MTINKDVERAQLVDQLAIANKKLATQGAENTRLAAQLAIANKKLATQSAEKTRLAAELELIITNKAMAFESATRARLVIANKLLALEDKENAQLAIANKKLVTESAEKTKLAADLRESEFRWKFAIEGSGDGLWDWSVPQSKVFFSTRWKSMLGFMEDEIGSGLDEWSKRIHPDDLAKTMADVQAHLRGTTPFYINEHRVSCKNGSYKWILDRGLVVERDATGKALRMIGTHTDVTERKLSEAALQESQVALKEAQRIAHVGSWKLDLANNHVVMSEELYHMYGLNQQEPLSDYTEHSKLFTPESWDRLSTALPQTAASGIPYQLELEMIKPDGSHGWVLARGEAVRDASGSIVALQGTATDITKRKQTEESIRISQARFGTIFIQAPFGIAIIDSFTGQFYEINPRYAEIAGRTIEEITTINWMSITHPDDVQKDLDNMALLNAGKIPNFKMDKRYIHPNGSIVWVSMAIAPLKIEQNISPRHLCMIEDITKRKQAELELQIAATAFESQEAMMINDANRLILRVNHAFTDITGYTQAEVLGQNPHIYSSGRQAKEFYTSMWDSVGSQGVWQGEIWNRRKNGEAYPAYLTITAVKDTTGRVTNYVGTFTDITLSKAASEKIKNLAFYDYLTQLPNRRLLVDRLQQALIASTRHKQRGALLFLDLDYFKNLNDTLGHDMGDLLLEQAAKRLIGCVREGDTVARIGGDEFVILIEGLYEGLSDAATQTEVVTHKILSALSQAYQLGSHEYYSSASIGVTLFDGHEVEIEELLKHADIAMYDAKKAGRNTVRFYDPAMQKIITVRTDMERELRYAIAQHQFQLYYQIQVDHLGQALGAEALIRWLHPGRGMILPFQFISLAEEVGLILPIGQWVLDTVCAQLKAWEQNPMTRDLTISVNVSAKQFNQQDFVKRVKATVVHYAINPKMLNFELTESILLDDMEAIVNKMSTLKMIGIRFELDDFGTGYSSLQYLKKLPLYQLKIDQSFVNDIASDADDQAIVRTIIAMAQSLTLEVIAEGVETEEQRERLLHSGCTRYQGYLFGKPVPISEFEVALRGS